MIIKVKRINKDIDFPEIIDKGDWIDLRAAKDVKLKAPQSGTLKKITVDGVANKYRDITFDTVLIPLGVAMQLPKGTEAMVLPRSGTFENFGISLANSEGVIDNTYQGNNDEWQFHAVAFRNTEIKKNDRICQFRVQLSQKATMWQKIKWLFSSRIKLIEVDELNGVDRKGFSSTGIK